MELKHHILPFLLGAFAVNIAPYIKQKIFKLKSKQPPITANQNVENWPHERKIHTFYDKIHVAVGYALANSVFIETDDGLILIDTTENEEALTEIFDDIKFFQQPTKLSTLIYTHHHPDHVLGGLAVDGILTKFGQTRRSLEVIAHNRFIEEFNRVITNIKMTYSRAAGQFGNLLPMEHQINAGIGQRLKAHGEMRLSLIRPTKTFDQQLDIEIGGLTLQIVHAPGETDDQINVILPDLKTIIAGDNIYPAFPNLYAIRGVPTRNTKIWSDSVRMISKLAEKFGEDTVLIGMHGPPINADVEVVSRTYSDAIQFVHDQTVRLLNQGKDVSEIIDEVKEIYPFWDEYYLKEQYGTLEWSIKGIVSHYVGWFDGKPKNLQKYQGTQEKWLKSIGGCEKIAELVKSLSDSSDRNDWLHALELLDFCRSHSDDFVETENKLLQRIAYSESSPLARNYFLTQGLQVDTLFPNKLQTKAILNKDYLDIDVLFDTMTTKLLPSISIDNFTLKIDLADIQRVFTLHLSNKVLRKIPDTDNLIANTTIICSEENFRKILANPFSAVGKLLGSGLKVDGDKMSLINFLKNLKP